MLLQEKKNYYESNNDDESLVEIEEEKIVNLQKAKIDFKGLYYSLDGHNFFKRVDRYYNKKLIFPFFIYTTLFNLFEIILNIILLTCIRKQSNEYNTFQRIFTFSLNMIYIIFIHFMATFTITKLKIQTYIYY